MGTSCVECVECVECVYHVLNARLDRIACTHQRRLRRHEMGCPSWGVWLLLRNFLKTPICEGIGVTICAIFILLTKNRGICAPFNT